ncbi:hypothetical protein NEAUS04_0804 [Nematocida ausubeli]|nr:hypothetical protein NEAUS04_0804 [Nematocida ausubeli]
MAWRVHTLSRNTGSDWAHINAMSCLQITLFLVSTTICVQAEFRNCKETLETIPILDEDTFFQQEYASIGVHLKDRKIQLKLASEREAASLLDTILYMQMMYRLRFGLSSITQNHTSTMKTPTGP